MSSDEVAQRIAQLAEEIRSLRDEVRTLKPDELLTVAQYAKFAKMSEHAVRAAISRGTIKAERIGSRLRIRRPF